MADKVEYRRIRKILLDIFSEFRDNDLNDAKFMLKDKITADEKEKMDIYSLSDTLEHLRYYDTQEMDFDGLERLLRDIGRNDLAQKLQREVKGLNHRPADRTRDNQHSPDLAKSRTTALDDETEVDAPKVVKGASRIQHLTSSEQKNTFMVDDPLCENGANNSSSTELEEKYKKFKETYSFSLSDDVCLRGYQEELSEVGKSGQNTIICAPTGSGKTLTVASIIKHNLDSALSNECEYRVLYLVHIKFLIKEISKDLKRKLNDDLYCFGDSDRLQDLQTKRVILLTAQILVNALQAEVSLSNYDLLIFDECHNCSSDHPYNTIMRTYHEMKTNGKKLPQIIGLSATLGVGSITLESTIELCANLDVMQISRVRNKENKMELGDYSTTPLVDKVFLCKSRTKDSFWRIITTLMKQVVENIKWEDESNILENESYFGETEYETCLAKLKKYAEENKFRNIAKNCKFLLILNKALIYYKDLQGLDVVEHLRDKLQEPPDDVLEVEQYNYDDFITYENALNEEAIHEELDSNDKLLELKYLLIAIQKKDSKSRGIMFCHTKFVVSGLLRFISEDDDLSSLVKADKLIGQGGEDGINMNRQYDVIKRFEKGDINLLIATNIAEQGFNIPDCNFIIRYKYIGSVISRRQAQGRARKLDSSFYLIIEKDSKDYDREKNNKVREKRMDEALETIDNMKKAELECLIKKKQDAINKDIQASKINKESLHSEHNAEDVLIFCKDCHTELCRGTEIIKKGSNYLCVNDAFKEKIRSRTWLTPRKYRFNSLIGTTECNGPKCHNQFGSIAEYSSGEIGYVLNIKSILFEFNRNGCKISLKAWKQHSFFIEEISE